MSEQLTRFNYETMTKPGGRWSFFGAVLKPFANISVEQRMGCLLDYVDFIKVSMSAYTDGDDALATACSVAYSGLRDYQREQGDEETHDAIQDLDKLIKEHHGLDHRSQYATNPDPYIGAFYSILDGMVDIPQGA